MRPKTLALLLLALGCGLVASVGITQMMANRNKDAAVSGESQPIFVASNDIGLGDQLNSQVIRLEQWPKDKVPVGAISQLEQVDGRRSRTRLYAGEPILENKLLSRGASNGGPSDLIPKGYNVVTVKVDLVSGGGSLIMPGDRVDVMVHLVKDPSRDIPETVTRTILQDIKVFAVNDVLGLDGEKEGAKSIAAKTISLLVAPNQAAMVMLATQLGTVQLVMRSPGGSAPVANAQARPGELFGAGGKSQREKETLMEDGDADDQGKSILGLLGTMKKKPSAPAPKAPTPPAPPATWTTRILKPGAMEEVQFEKEQGAATTTSPWGSWKVIAAGQGGAESPPPTEDAKAAKPEPPFAPPPAPPKPRPKVVKSS
jgi:pilus assembly protein CpaB